MPCPGAAVQYSGSCGPHLSPSRSGSSPVDGAGRSGLSALRCTRRASFSRCLACLAFSRSRFAMVVLPARAMVASLCSTFRSGRTTGLARLRLRWSTSGSGLVGTRTGVTRAHWRLLRTRAGFFAESSTCQGCHLASDLLHRPLLRDDGRINQAELAPRNSQLGHRSFLLTIWFIAAPDGRHFHQVLLSTNDRTAVSRPFNWCRRHEYRDPRCRRCPDPEQGQWAVGGAYRKEALAQRSQGSANCGGFAHDSYG